MVIEIDGANAALEPALVTILRLVKPSVVADVHRRVALLIVDARDAQRLEKQRLGLLEDLLA